MRNLFLGNKKKFILSLVLLLVVVLVVNQKEDNTSAQRTNEKTDKIFPVLVQKAGDGKRLTSQVQYPATVVGDQEVSIVAGISGVVKSVNFAFGDQVYAGQSLARIDDNGTNLTPGKSGFENGQIQQLELAVRLAKEQLELAEKSYHDDDSFANRGARDIAKRQYESAQVQLKTAIDNRLVNAPITGTVTSRQVAIGDSVTPGQLIATISKTNKKKIQFFVDKNELGNFSVGKSITVKDGNSESQAKIVSLASQADADTKRFLIEAVPGGVPNDLFIGTVVNVSTSITQQTDNEAALFLPLSAVTIGQNESYIFLADNGVAKKMSIEVISVAGETAQIKADVASESQIVIDGNKLLKDGDKIEIKQ